MGEKILVTGATRSVGNAVVRLLADQGVYVRAAASNLEKARQMGWHGVEIVPFDYNDPATYASVFDGMTRLLLVMPPGYFEEHDQAVTGLVDFGQRAGISHIVFISALGTEKFYLSSQWVVEQHLQKCGVPHTILRSGWFFQNFCDDVVLRTSLLNDEFFVAFGEEARVSGVDVRDVASVAGHVLTTDGHANRIYSLGEYAMTGAEMAEVFAEVLKRPIRAVYISEHEAAQNLRRAGVPRQVAKWWRIVYQLMRQGVYDATIPDISRVLGRPSIPFKQYVQEHVACWQSGYSV